MEDHNSFPEDDLDRPCRRLSTRREGIAAMGILLTDPAILIVDEQLCPLIS